VVLVLLPGGTFSMGAQSDDPDGRNYDPIPPVSSIDHSVHEVCLSPCFVSKYELTQGQWLRLTGSNPAWWQGPQVETPLLRPIEYVSSHQFNEWLPRAGLVLPSEAQWEYAARGGTSTPWPTGDSPDSLVVARAANLGVSSDGYGQTAPVGRFSPNPFELHDVLGNVFEHCLDRFDESSYARSSWLDPLCPPSPGGEEDRMARGGSFGDSPTRWSRCSQRLYKPAGNADSRFGVRPARGLER
jgi:formylglycine-generating enzyme required for sulfatase activity